MLAAKLGLHPASVRKSLPYKNADSLEPVDSWRVLPQPSFSTHFLFALAFDAAYASTKSSGMVESESAQLSFRRLVKGFIEREDS